MVDEEDRVKQAEPEQATAEPEQATAESEQAAAEPEQAAAEPEQAAAEPEQATAESEQAAAEPEQAAAEPEQAAAEPERAAAEPEQAAAEPEQEAAEPEQATAQPAKGAAKKSDSNLRWYVVHAYSGFESYVKKVLESRIAMSEHKKKFGEIMVPTEEVVEMREGSRRKSERKFFPGYVLVQMEMDNDTWHLVKEVPKVLGFIGGTSDKPAPITEAEADAILNRVEEGVDRPRPKVLFEVGEVVRVNDGPFNDFNGVVEEVNYEKSKMLVSVQIFGRSTPVELAFGQVEKG